MAVGIKATCYGFETGWISGFHVEAERFSVPSVEDAECRAGINICIEAYHVLAVAEGNKNANAFSFGVVVLDVKVQAVRHSQPPV